MSNGTKVQKRDGRIESLDLDKMHLMVEEACKGLAGVSASQVEMKSGIQFYDGITTAEIQEILIRAASDLIDLDHPNYQFVAARLLLFALRKSLYGKMKELPNLEDHIHTCVAKEVYDFDIFNKYSKEEIENALGEFDSKVNVKPEVDQVQLQDQIGKMHAEITNEFTGGEGGPGGPGGAGGSATAGDGGTGGGGGEGGAGGDATADVTSITNILDNWTDIITAIRDRLPMQALA